MRTATHLLLAVFGVFGMVAGSVQAQNAAAAGDAPPAGDVAALPVGAATQRLLALQREGGLASATPRPIAGEVAHRSYERYLGSFNHPIPEKFGSSVSARPATGSGGTSLGTTR